MCTASALCIGMNGETWPHRAGDVVRPPPSAGHPSVRLGSGNELWAAALLFRPTASHVAAQNRPAAHTILTFLMLTSRREGCDTEYPDARCRRQASLDVIATWTPG